MSCSFGRSIISRNGSPWPRPPGSRRPRSYRSGRCCRTRSAGRWSRPRPQSAARRPPCIFCSAAETLWPLTARIQPLAEHSTVTGSRSISASAGISTGSGAAPIAVRRRPSGVSPPNSVCGRARPPWRSRAIAAGRSRAGGRAAPASAASASSSLRIAISSSRRKARSRMLRIASAWISVRSQRAIISAFGSSSSRMMRITSSRLTIDDDLAAQDLHAPRDRGEAMAAAALQHHAAMVEKGLQRLLQVHHPRHAERVEHIEVERHPHFELGQPEQLLHQHVGIDVAGLRLEDEADVLGRFVADVGEQRQLLLFEQRRDLFDQPALLHLIRHLGDDDLVEPVAQRLPSPSGRAGGSCRGRSRRPARMLSGGSTRTPPVGKSGPGHRATSSATAQAGWSIRCSSAAHSSPTLCGGMLVAMPTAMPEAPLASRFGKRAGRTTGSLSSPS